VYAEAMLDYENFNFTAPFPSEGGYALVDMREILHDTNDLGSRLDRYECTLTEPQTNCNRLFSDMLLVVEHTASSFNPAYLYSYCTYHISECELQSGLLTTLGGYATTSLTMALFISVVFYITLSLSNIREEADEGNMKPLMKFRRVATWIIMFGFGLLLFGVILFFLGLVRIMRIRTPLNEIVNNVILVNLYFMLIPASLFFLFVSLLLPKYALWGTVEEVAAGSGGSKRWTTNPQNVAPSIRRKDSDDELGGLGGLPGGGL
jgi:hypothetical protein